MDLSDKEIEFALEYQNHCAEERAPQVVYKYRSLADAKSFVRILDIVKNRRIYMPTKGEINDPFEGGNVECLSEEANIELEKWGLTHRFLSLSATCFSPVMWAHYASEENGICIGFFTDDSFNAIEPVHYLKDVRKPVIAFEQPLATSLEFMYKSQDWEYEEEYRLDGYEDNKYLLFSSREIACVIIGEKVEEEVQEALMNELKQLGITVLFLEKDYREKRYYIVPEEDKQLKFYEKEEVVSYLSKRRDAFSDEKS